MSRIAIKQVWRQVVVALGQADPFFPNLLCSSVMIGASVQNQFSVPRAID